jgi:outer membrane receptor for ferrienterochelin and colicins
LHGLLGLWAVGLPAVAPAGDEAEMRKLLALLDQQTTLATSSRMNADYIPGMATVLRGEDLLARGVRTVWEALGLVPGLTQGMEFTGERQILSRGVGHGYASGNIKFMLDGISLNTTLTGQANPLLNMPIEQVERIEVIRGPGSSIHGEYAYAGVVDVISRRRDRTLYAGGGSFSSFGGGALWHGEDPERGLTYAINLAATDTDGADSRVDQDALHHSGDQALSNAPGPANEDARYRGLSAHLTWGRAFASFHYLEDGFGDHFGVNHFLPPDQDHLVSSNGYSVLEAGGEFDLAEDLVGRLRLEALRHRRQRDRMYVAPAGYWGNSDPVFMDLDYEEQRWLGELRFDWRPQDHEVLFSLEYSDTAIDSQSWDWYGWPWELPGDWIDAGMSRQIRALVLQDQYRLDERITLTATLRYDDYSDVGDFLSPRLALVWRLDEANILKAQFARAFRPPTFYELTYPGDGRIDPSEIHTIEVGYILKRPGFEWRLTLFDSRLDDPIHFDDPTNAGFDNGEDVRLRGVELEYQQRLGGRFKLDANLSYVDAQTEDSHEPLTGGAEWLANVALLWQPDDRWNGALQGRYVGERARHGLDPRSDLDAYVAFDLSLSYRFSPRGLTLRGGVKNLTDADVRFPDQVTTDYSGTYYLPYPDDYPQAGRQWWLGVSYDF